MTHVTPDHLVRLSWQMNRILLTCTACPWTAAVGYPDLATIDVTAELRRQAYRQASQVAAMHGWPEMDWQPADSILTRQCDCQPDPTATRGFWDRIRGAIA